MAVTIYYKKKHPKRWRKDKRILDKIKRFHTKARNILVDSARENGKWVIGEARGMNANVIVLEKLNKMINHVKDSKKNCRGLYLII